MHSNTKGLVRRGYVLCAVVCVLFVTASFSQGADGEWRFESQRPAIAPVSAIDTKVKFEGEPTLALKGGGKDHAAGYWYKVVPAEAGSYYEFRTHFRSSAVDEPARSILARVLWQNASRLSAQ